MSVRLIPVSLTSIMMSWLWRDEKRFFRIFLRFSTGEGKQRYSYTIEYHDSAEFPRYSSFYPPPSSDLMWEHKCYVGNKSFNSLENKIRWKYYKKVLFSLGFGVFFLERVHFLTNYDDFVISNITKVDLLLRNAQREFQSFLS